jgi:predicted Zn-dependent peptidase
MKNRLLVILIFTVIPAYSQVDRSTPPAPGPAPTINVASFTSFQLENGLTVFVIPNHKLPFISYTLTFKHVPVIEGEYAGYTSITGQMLGTATKTRTKDSIDQELDYLGATISFSGSSAYASSLTKHNEKLLEILSDLLINATFRQEELDKLLKRNITAYYANLNDPDYISNRVMKKMIFGANHPYGELFTDTSLKKITLDVCKNYYLTYFRPNNAYLAVIGDITPEKAKNMLSTYFSGWEARKTPENCCTEPAPPDNRKVIMVDRPNSVQSSVKICYPVNYQIGCDDYMAAKLANMILGGGPYRLFLNLREKHGFTYGAYSRLKPDKYSGYFEAFAEVRKSATDSAVAELIHEMERIRNNPVSQEELETVKNDLSGNFALALEKPGTIARFAFNIQKYNLPPLFYANYLKMIESVTANNIQQAANKYILPEKCYIIVVGDRKEIEEGLKQFTASDIIFVDENGNQTN